MKNNFRRVTHYMLDVVYEINELTKKAPSIFISEYGTWCMMRDMLTRLIRVLQLVIYYNDKKYKRG